MLEVDDFLGLRKRRLRHVRLVLFAGVSGSGKTTALEYLARTHPDFRATPVERVRSRQGRLTKTPSTPATPCLVLYDEITTSDDVRRVGVLLKMGHTVAAATHLPAGSHLELSRRFRTRFFRTDRDPRKLGRFLSAKDVAWTRTALRRFYKVHGASYSLMEVILERYPDDDFDRALLRFEARCRIERGGQACKMRR